MQECGIRIERLPHFGSHRIECGLLIGFFLPGDSLLFMVGLFIAIPAIALYNILRNRVARLVLEVGIVSENLMGRFENVQLPKKEG